MQLANALCKVKRNNQQLVVPDDLDADFSHFYTNNIQNHVEHVFRYIADAAKHDNAIDFSGVDVLLYCSHELLYDLLSLVDIAISANIPTSKLPRLLGHKQNNITLITPPSSCEHMKKLNHPLVDRFPIMLDNGYFLFRSSVDDMNRVGISLPDIINVQRKVLQTGTVCSVTVTNIDLDIHKGVDYLAKEVLRPLLEFKLFNTGFATKLNFKNKPHKDWDQGITITQVSSLSEIIGAMKIIAKHAQGDGYDSV